jgi:hypothetical protein
VWVSVQLKNAVCVVVHCIVEPHPQASMTRVSQRLMCLSLGPRLSGVINRSKASGRDSGRAAIGVSEVNIQNVSSVLSLMC